MSTIIQTIYNNHNPEEIMDKIVSELIGYADSDFKEIQTLISLCDFIVLKPILIRIQNLFQDLSKLSSFKKLWTKVEECNHDNPDGSKMIFHLESRLDRHLVIACLETGIQSIRQEIKNEQLIFLNMVTALFHDIGKPSSQCINQVYNHKSYKGHGWMGQIIWTKLMNEFKFSNESKYLSYFTNKTHNLIGKGIGYHMCGLHRSDCDCKLTKMLQQYLTILPSDVQELLQVINRGDVLGSRKEDFDIDNYFKSREIWKEMLNIQNPLNIAFEDTKNWYNGIIITLNGLSGSGKSTTAKHIQSILGDSCVVIERDLIMAQCIFEWLNNSNDPLKTMELSIQGKDKRSKLLQKFEMTQEELDKLIIDCKTDLLKLQTGKGYLLAYSLYKELQFSQLVNSKMRNITKYALRNRKIVVGDSMIYGTNDHKQVLPDEIATAFRIAIYNVESNIIEEGMALRRGMDLKSFSNRMRKGYGFEHLSKGKNSILEANLHNTSSFPKMIFDSDTPFFRIVHSPLIDGIDPFVTQVISQLPDLLKILPNTFQETKAKNDYILDDPKALSKFLNPLITKFEGNMDAVAEYLASLGYVLKDASLHEYKLSNTIPKTSFYLITYKEGMVKWNTYYCHATRGAAFYVKDYQIQVIKSGPPKSPEIQSLKTKQSDVDTQDSKQRLGYGHVYMQEVLTDDDNDDNINFTISGKRDGSLSMWSVVSTNSPHYNVIAEHIHEAPILADSDWHPSKIASMLWSLPHKYGFSFGLILSSQNTLFVGTKDMMNWYLSAAILSTTCEPIKSFHNCKEEDLVGMLQPFLINISKFVFNLSKTFPDLSQGSTTISFEAICPNRTDPVNHKEHIELACSYQNATNYLLGLRINFKDGSIGDWIPHFDIQKEMKGCFLDPLFWKTDSVEFINKIFDLLQTGDLSVFPIPDNLRIQDNPNWIDYESIDPEGFILYSTGGKLNFNNLSSKLKDTLYYILHKLEKYHDKKVPGQKYTWQDEILRLAGWYHSKYPIVSRMQQAQNILSNGIPEIISELSTKYENWFNDLDTDSDGNHILNIETKRGPKTIKQRDGSIFQKPFVPLFINDQETINIIGQLIHSKTEGVLGSNFMSEVKSAIMGNQEWLSQDEIDISNHKWKSMIEIAKMAHNSSYTEE